MFGVRFALWLLWLLLQMLLSVFSAPALVPMSAPVVLDQEPMIEVFLEEPALGHDDLPEPPAPAPAPDVDVVYEAVDDEPAPRRPELRETMLLGFIGSADDEAGTLMSSLSMSAVFGTSDDLDMVVSGISGSSVSEGVLGVRMRDSGRSQLGAGGVALGSRAERVGSLEPRGVFGGVEGGVEGGVLGGVISNGESRRSQSSHAPSSKAPISLRRVEPRYPRALRGDDAVSDTCSLLVRVDADGRASEIEFSRCLEPFREAAQAAAERSRWHAKGEVVDGETAAPGWIAVDYDFAP